jgi:hypothetical protein
MVARHTNGAGLGASALSRRKNHEEDEFTAPAGGPEQSEVEKLVNKAENGVTHVMDSEYCTVCDPFQRE